MLAQARAALVALVTLTLLTGVAYPLLITGIGHLAFARQAEGSTVMLKGQPAGSSLLGQPFDDPRYFWSRPSATGPFPYNAGASTGSNQAPTNPALIDAVKGRIQALRDADPDNRTPIPVDLVTASGSGLDPDISPAAAYYQAARVARARGHMDVVRVKALVAKHTDGPTLGFLGEPRVNVLELNLDLDALAP